MEQNRDPETNPHLYSQYLTEVASTYNGLQIVCSINGVGKIGQLHAKKMKLDYFLMLPSRICSRWIKDLNIRPQTIKILEKIIGIKVLDIGFSKKKILKYLLRKGREKKN